MPRNFFASSPGELHLFTGPQVVRHTKEAHRSQIDKQCLLTNWAENRQKCYERVRQNEKITLLKCIQVSSEGDSVNIVHWTPKRASCNRLRNTLGNSRSSRNVWSILKRVRDSTQ